MNTLIIIIIILIISISLLNYILNKKTLGFLYFFTKFFELSSYFFTFQLFQKTPCHKILKKNNSYKNFAIIIQGPIISKDDFTIKTLKMYVKKYSKSPIIFSGWKRDIETISKKLKNKRIHLISNNMPIYAGARNINLQAISTKNAILHAKKLGCKYVLKTRSDTRLYSDSFEDDLINTIRFYKLDKKFKSHQKERIITTSFMLYYRLYQISDLIMFGNVDDLYNYFNVMTSKKIESNFENIIKKVKFHDPLYQLDHKGNGFCPELYFFYEFFRKMNFKLKWTVKDSLMKISENFIVIDNQKLSLYFKKSNKSSNHFSHKPIPNKLSIEFNFIDWLTFFYKFKNIKNL